MNSNRLETNLVVLDKVLVASQVLRDFMISLGRLQEVVSSHLVIFLMNLRNSLEALKEQEAEDHVVGKLLKEVKI